MTNHHHANQPDAPLAKGVSPYTTKQKLLRVLWNYLGQTLFSLTFHNWYELRASILRAFGASVGKPTRIRPSVKVEQPWNLSIGNDVSIGDHAIIYCLGKVTIHDNASISQLAHLCAGTHDLEDPDMPLLRPPVTVGKYAWVAADAFVGPNVTVAEGCVIGARSSVYKNTDPWMVYAGNPARPIKPRILKGIHDPQSDPTTPH